MKYFLLNDVFMLLCTEYWTVTIHNKCIKGKTRWQRQTKQMLNEERNNESEHRMLIFQFSIL